MKVTCQSCGARYGIADAKIRGRRAKVRCKSCKAVFVVDGTALDPDAEPMRESMTPSMSLPPPEPDGGVYDVPSGSEIASAPVVPGTPVTTEAPYAAPVDDGVVWSVSVADNDERTLSTDELVASLAAGELGDDPYIWRDGMGDWAPPAQVPELAALLAGAGIAAAPPALGTESDASEPFGSVPPAAEDGPTPAPFAAPEPDPTYARQPETRANYVPVEANPTPAPFDTNADYAPVAPRQSDSSPELAAAPAPMFPPAVDLFAGVDRAGSEEDVIASVPPPPPAIPTTKTGERHETSVLFTLDALRAGAGAAAAPPTAAIAPPPSLADLVGTSRGAFEEADLSALAAPVAEEVVTTSAVGGQRPPQKSKKTLWIGLAAAAVLFGAIGFAVASGGGDENDGTGVAANATANPDEGVTEPADAPKPADTKAADEPADTKPASGVEPAPDDAAAPEAPEAGGSAAPATGTDAAKPADKPAPVAANDKPRPRPRPRPRPKPRTKPEPKPEPSPGGQAPPFNLTKAKAALSAAARQAKGCKRAGGPTGKVKVSVTFSNSGRTTSSSVVAGPVRGTLIGGCVANAFRKAKVPAFSGPRQTKTVSFMLK